MGLRAIVLPGLDGRPDLRAEFAAALAPEFDATVLALPDDPELDYDALVQWARARLPSGEPFLLVAESFSGPIAIQLAAQRPPGLIGVVLAATFARTPRRGLKALYTLSRWLPLQRLAAPLMFLMMGRWATPEWKRRLRQALLQMDARVLRQRLLACARIDVAAQVADVECPILYLQASHDRLVPRSGWETIRDHSHNAVCIGLEGPHMLLEACPTECAEAVKR